MSEPKLYLVPGGRYDQDRAAPMPVDDDATTGRIPERRSSEGLAWYLFTRAVGFLLVLLLIGYVFYLLDQSKAIVPMAGRP